MFHFFKQYHPLRNILFVVGEGMFIYLALQLAAILFLGHFAFYQDPWFHLKLFMISCVCQVCIYYNDLYNLKGNFGFKKLSIQLLKALGFSAILLAVINFAFPAAVISSGIIMLGNAFIVTLVVFWRFCYSIVLSRGLFNQRILLLGSGDLIKKIREEVDGRKDCGCSVIREIPESIDEIKPDQMTDVSPICMRSGYIASNHACGQGAGRFESGATSTGCEHFERTAAPHPGVRRGYETASSHFEGLAEICRQLQIDKVVVDFREKRDSFPIQELIRCRVEGVEVIDGNSFYELLTGKLLVEFINPGWLIFSSGFEKSWSRRFAKRMIDLVVSGSLVILFLPFFLLTAVFIKLDSPGPVFFSQARVGERRRIYRMYKFRSMVRDAEKQTGPVWAQENDPRVTRVGRVMRRLRIDEIPQLWNVLKGDMSFVGPRPERKVFVRELEKIVPYYRERFTVKPGITGWAQVRYGYGASVADAVEKLNYDLFYIKNMSFGMDILILILSLKIVLFRQGAR